MNANTNADSNDLAWYKENFDQSHYGDNKGSSSYQGMSPNQVFENIKSQYTVQDPTTKKNRITADPAQRENMFLQVIDSTAGMSDAQVEQILSNLGLSKKEIAQFEKNYSGK
jgi:hypothetical protein